MVAVTVADYRELARKRLPPMFFEYLDGGSYAEITLRRNVADMEAIALRQRVMKDVSKLSMGIELFGQQLSMPMVLGPVGFSGMYARRGEVQAARAAHRAGIQMCLSSLSICDIQEVTRGAGKPIWYQLYMIKDRGFMAALLERIKAQNCPVLVFTVDLAVLGTRYRDMKAGMSTPGLMGDLRRIWQGVTHPEWLWDVHLNGAPHEFGNLKGAVMKGSGIGDFANWVVANLDPTVTWDDLNWVRERWDGPIVIKGVLDPEDAREALRIGADGIVVSNHGGRQLDGVESSVKALPRIADAVAERVPVLMDGGLRTGLDVMRALALGAKACMLGRAWAYPLAAGGGPAVSRVLGIMRSELRVAMALTGCTDVRQAGRDLLA